MTQLTRHAVSRDRIVLAAIAAAGLLVGPSLSQAALKPYTGGDGTLWSSNGSWSSGIPTSGADSVSLRSTTTSTGSTFDLADGFTLTGLSAGSRSLDSSDSAADHTINLNARTLNVTGNIVVGETNGNQDFTGSLTLRNGTMSQSNGALDIGIDTTGNTGIDGVGSLTAGADLVFNTNNLTRLRVGWRTGSSGSAVGTLDLSAASGTLNVAGGTDNIQIGVRRDGGSNSGFTSGVVTLGNGWTSTTLGSSSVRADMGVAYRVSNNEGITGSFTQSGGTFTAHLGYLYVGQTFAGDTPTVTGTVSLTGATSNIDVNTLRIATQNNNHTGTVTVGTGDVLVNTAAIIGGGTKGTLNLNRTDFAVGSGATLTLGTTGEINSTIGSVSAGIDIANTATSALVVNASATIASNRGIEITFQENPIDADWVATAAEANGIFYGLKWAGDKVNTLKALLGTNQLNGGTLDGDRLQWYDSALTGQFAGKVSIFYDGTGPGTLGTDATYIGFYVDVIPEPGCLALLAAGGLTMLPIRGRHRPA